MPPDDGPVIVNATPIITLSLIGRLDLLRLFYGRVLVPEAVRQEIQAGSAKQASLDLERLGWVEVVRLQNPRSATLLSDLDRGEAEVIALALERNARLVVLDERLARLHARKLELPLTGAVGVLIRAKREGHVERLAPLLGMLRESGIWLSEALVREALQMADERPQL